MISVYMVRTKQCTRQTEVKGDIRQIGGVVNRGVQREVVDVDWSEI